MRGLTSEFGMGSGISPSLWSPEKNLLYILKAINSFSFIAKIDVRDARHGFILTAKLFAETIKNQVNRRLVLVS